MAGKRIYELTEKSSLASGDFIAVDSSGQQDAQKVNASKITLPLANISQSSDEYSSTTTYKVGDMVIHDNVLYVCNTACAAAPWSTNQGYFTATTITAELSSLNSDLANSLIYDQGNVKIRKTGNLCVASIGNAAYNYEVDVSSYLPAENIHNIVRYSSASNEHDIAIAIINITTGKLYFINKNGLPFANGHILGELIWICG